MRRLVNWLSNIMAMIFFTLMVVIDYFPNIWFDMKFAITGAVLFLLISTFTRQKGSSLFKSSKQQLIFTILLGGYLFLLFQLLTSLGGVSRSGIGINDPIVWLVYIFSVFMVYRKYKREVMEKRK